MVVADVRWGGDGDVISVLVDGCPRRMYDGLFVEQVPAGVDGRLVPVVGGPADSRVRRTVAR